MQVSSEKQYQLCDFIHQISKHSVRKDVPSIKTSFAYLRRASDDEDDLVEVRLMTTGFCELHGKGMLMMNKDWFSFSFHASSRKGNASPTGMVNSDRFVI